ncbi:MAG: hypothetical protein K1X64_04720 [Myxococcaceae bacterium]|nr:hypothetical protein [Myxococcaceae bacterium]
MNDAELLVKLIEADDFVHAERVAEFMETGGIEVFIRSTHEIGGMLGAPGNAFILEVSKVQEAEARQLLAAFKASSIEERDAAVEPEREVASTEKTRVTISNIKAYQVASVISLLSGLITIALGVSQKAGLPIGVFGAAIVDFLIWRRFTAPELSLVSAKNVRLFALLRTVLSLVISVGAVASGLSTGGGQLIVFAYVGFLYLKPLVTSEKPDESVGETTQ